MPTAIAALPIGTPACSSLAPIIRTSLRKPSRREACRTLPLLRPNELFQQGKRSKASRAYRQFSSEVLASSWQRLGRHACTEFRNERCREQLANGDGRDYREEARNRPGTVLLHSNHIVEAIYTNKAIGEILASGGTDQSCCPGTLKVEETCYKGNLPL